MKYTQQIHWMKSSYQRRQPIINASSNNYKSQTLFIPLSKEAENQIENCISALDKENGLEKMTEQNESINDLIAVFHDECANLLIHNLYVSWSSFLEGQCTDETVNNAARTVNEYIENNYPNLCKIKHSESQLEYNQIFAPATAVAIFVAAAINAVVTANIVVASHGVIVVVAALTVIGGKGLPANYRELFLDSVNEN